jgi:hypothetical protein
VPVNQTQGGLIFECDPNDVSTTVGSNLAIAATSQAFVLLTFIPRTGNVAAIELLQFMQLLALIETIREFPLSSEPLGTISLKCMHILAVINRSLSSLDNLGSILALRPTTPRSKASPHSLAPTN